MRNHLLLGCSLLLSGIALGCNQAEPQPVSSAPPDAEQSSTQSSPAEPLDVGDQSPDTSASNAPREQGGSQPSPEEGQRLEGNQIVAPTLNDQTEMQRRPFATLQAKDTDVPEELIEHLREIDSALQDLVLAGSSNMLDEGSFRQAGLRLGRMKQEAGKRLANAPSATAEQRKSGMLAQLIALSHMSGLRHVESAKELSRFAEQLVSSGDPDLAHQSRVVLLGFELQALQNGVHSAPEQLLAGLEGLFERPEDRGFPEFMVLQQARQVLTQMGFNEAADSVRETLIREYRNSPDLQLRGEAWLIETQTSQAYQNFLLAYQPLGTEGFDPQAALAAVRGLYQAFPSMHTIEQIASTVSNIEYSGQVDLSDQIASFIEQAAADFPQADRSRVDQILASHRARLGLLNEELPLSGLVDFQNAPFQWSDYRGKVVLVDFWASWCVPCLKEIPRIREVYADLREQGFEVVSINMDEKLAAAEDFVRQQKFPWRTYRSQDPQALGFSAPFAQQFGVSAIPFMILIGRDGLVSAIHVRGDKLRPRIEQLLNAEEN